MPDAVTVAIEAVREALEAIVPATDVIQYDTSGFVAVDLVAVGGASCRRIMPLGAGTITITTLAGEERTIDVAAGVAEDVRATAISETDADLKVYW